MFACTKFSKCAQNLKLSAPFFEKERIHSTIFMTRLDSDAIGETN